MASNHTFTFFSLAAMLATGCGSKGHTGDTGAKDGATRQGSGSCLGEFDTHSECITFYGISDYLDADSWCDEHGGEWSDEACPSGFDASCDTEIYDGTGLVWYSYDMSEEALDSNELMCDAGGGIWYE